MNSRRVALLGVTVFAVACSREPRLRRVLSREMVVYRKVRPPDRQAQ